MMKTSLSTFMTAVIAVAGAAIIALVLAEQTSPPDAQGKMASRPAPLQSGDKPSSAET